MYNPNSLEEERLSWRSVVYYNIVRPVRRIFEAYEAFGDADSDVEMSTESDEAQASASGTDKEMQLMKLRLAPLLETEPRLEARIAGGVPIASSGKGNIFVRSGWQARSMFKSRSQSRTSFTGQRSSFETSSRKSEDSAMVIVGEKDMVLEETANILNACKDDVRELWNHPAVKRLRDKRKLKLEEWAEL